MFVAIPSGYFVAAFLLVTGVVNCVEYVQNTPEGTNYTEVLNGVSQAGWPLIAAVVILLLIQVCQQLEKLRMAASYSPEKATEKKQAKKKKTAGEFPTEAISAPAPALAHLATEAPAPNTAQQQPQRYPNSPIPGAARPPADASPTRAAKMVHTPKQAEAQGLNFFKVD